MKTRCFCWLSHICHTKLNENRSIYYTIIPIHPNISLDIPWRISLINKRFLRIVNNKKMFILRKKKFLKKGSFINFDIFPFRSLLKILIHESFISYHIEILDRANIADIFLLGISAHIMVYPMMWEFRCSSDNEIISFINHIHLIWTIKGIYKVETIVIKWELLVFIL